MTTLGPFSSFTTNSTNLSSTNDDQLEKAISFTPFGITIALWSITIGSVGNLLTILTYISNRQLRTTFNLFLVNLAVIDFWTSVGMLPFNLAGYIQLEWPFPESPFTERLQAFQYFSCGYTSIVILVAITVNRFIGVMFPESYCTMYTTKRTIYVLILCHTVAPILLSPFLFGSDDRCITSSNPKGGVTGFHPTQLLCTFTCLPSGSDWDFYMQFTRVMFQFLPLIVMAILYFVILASLKKKRDAVSIRLGIKKKNPPPGVCKGVAKNTKTRTKSSQEQRRQKEDKRMIRISVAICVVFSVTFLPSVIVNLLPKRYEIDVRWHMAASNVTWFHPSINPLIYILLNRRFRKEYWRIVQFGIGKAKGRFIHDSSSSPAAVRRTPHTSSNAQTHNSESEAPGSAK